MAQSANMDASELARDIAAGLASATTATERAALVPAELVEAIQQLKTQRDAVILAHYYVAPEVQAVADYVGDSFYLAKLAKSLPQQTIVLCGVEFMGESAKLLNPTKTVLLPEPGADCPMAHMVKRETVDAARAEYGDDLAVRRKFNHTITCRIDHKWNFSCLPDLLTFFQRIYSSAKNPFYCCCPIIHSFAKCNFSADRTWFFTF